MQKSQFFFLLAVAAIPIQLNKFFLTNNSLVLGVPIDYRTPSIYLSDIAISLSFIFFIFEKKRSLTSTFAKNKPYIVSLFALTLFLFVNSIIFSADRLTSIIFALNILEMALFSIASLYFLASRQIWPKFLFVLKMSVLWQSLLAIAQFTVQGSIGLYFLGERAFDTSTGGIAHAQIFGSQFLRSYGTFPHPNVLAAYLLISIAVLTLWSKPKSRKNKIRTISTDNILFVVTILALVFTFSKTAILLLAFLFILKSKTIKTAILKIIACLFIAYIYLVYFSQTYIETVAERLTLSQAALAIARENLVMGVGSNNFILELAKLNLISIGEVRLLQPVHNVFLLILSENGMTGLLIFAVFIFQVAKKPAQKISICLSALLLVYLAVDHFLWTLQQGQLLLFLTTAIIYGLKSNTQADIFKSK